MNISKNKPTTKLEKQKKLIDVAYSLFLKNSVSATAIDDVVKAAGIARGTFYLYFKNKSDLVEHVIMYKSADAMKSLIQETQKTIEQENLSFEDICRLFVEDYINFFVIHKDILNIIQKNASSCLKDIPFFHDNAFDGLYDEILERFTSYGYTKENAKKAMYIIIDMIGSVCSDTVLHSKPFSIEDIRESLISSAMCIIKGLKG